MAIRELDLNESSNVKAGYWDSDTKELIVEFASGGRGAYVGVDEEEAIAFEQSQSPGKYIHQFLKPRFPWVRR